MGFPNLKKDFDLSSLFSNLSESLLASRKKAEEDLLSNPAARAEYLDKHKSDAADGQDLQKGFSEQIKNLLAPLLEALGIKGDLLGLLGGDQQETKSKIELIEQDKKIFADLIPKSAAFSPEKLKADIEAKIASGELKIDPLKKDEFLNGVKSLLDKKIPTADLPEQLAQLAFENRDISHGIELKAEPLTGYTYSNPIKTFLAKDIPGFIGALKQGLPKEGLEVLGKDESHLSEKLTAENIEDRAKSLGDNLKITYAIDAEGNKTNNLRIEGDKGGFNIVKPDEGVLSATINEWIKAADQNSTPRPQTAEPGIAANLEMKTPVVKAMAFGMN